MLSLCRVRRAIRLDFTLQVALYALTAVWWGSLVAFIEGFFASDAWTCKLFLLRKGRGPG
jgi:hypothetical protein